MCTIIAKNKLIGKNFDSIANMGMLFTNKIGLIKSSAVFPPKTPLEWVSLYGSITFSQCGRELPVCGVNEKGLVVEQATLLSAAYPDEKAKPTLSSLEATQYLLDTCASVEEAVNALEKIGIEPSAWPVHYAFFDERGNKAIVEFRLEGKKICRRHAENAVVMDNTEFQQEECLLNLITVDDVWKTLDELEAENTIWSNLYDLAEGKLYLKSSSFKEIVCIEVNHLDYSPQSKGLMLNLKEDQPVWKEYSEEEDHRLISDFLANPAVGKLMKLNDADAMINFIINHTKNYDIVNRIVLRFLEGDLVKQLPIKESHKQYVLKYLISKFEIGKDYSEKQVNAIIDQWHTFGDYFVLRRELIDSGLLKRLPNGSKYWRE